MVTAARAVHHCGAAAEQRHSRPPGWLGLRAHDNDGIAVYFKGTDCGCKGRELLIDKMSADSRKRINFATALGHWALV